MSRRKKARVRTIFFGIAAVLYACLIFYSSSQPANLSVFNLAFPYSDKVLHFLAFLLFGGLLFMTFASAGWRPWDAPLAITLGVVYGVIDEAHQLVVPGRVADPFDALMDCAGVLVSVIVLAIIDRWIHPSRPSL